MNKKQEVQHETYNDGFISYGNIKTIRNKNKVKIGEELEQLGKLPFKEKNVRDNDNIVADSLGYTINRKIMVPYRKLPQNIKVKINNEEIIYDIVKRDTADHIKLYLYLQIASNEKSVTI